MKARYKSKESKRERAKQRRDQNRDNERCVNENSRRTHGLATHGSRCEHCSRVWRRTK